MNPLLKPILNIDSKKRLQFGLLFAQVTKQLNFSVKILAKYF